MLVLIHLENYKLPSCTEEEEMSHSMKLGEIGMKLEEFRKIYCFVLLKAAPQVSLQQITVTIQCRLDAGQHNVTILKQTTALSH